MHNLDEINICDNNDNNNHVNMIMVKNINDVDNNKIIIKEYNNSHGYVTW